MKILAINPGSTSTKIAVYKEENEVFVKNIKHSSGDLVNFETITDQYEFRKKVILEELKFNNLDVNDMKVIIGIGGLVRPIPSGIYAVNEAMRKDLKLSVFGQHASNLGGLIAEDIAKSVEGAKSYIADPVVVDEMDEIARISGHPYFERKSIFHALNQKAIARRYAKEQGEKYEDLNLIIAHLGGGISVGAHKKGRVIDVNNALDGEGPFSPERSGTIPVGQLATFCFSGDYSHEEIKKMITGKGGFVAYLATNDAYTVEKNAENGDKKAALIQDAMAYQVAKEIGALSCVLEGDVDAVILTGGIAHGKPFVEAVKKRVKHIADFYVYPGEDEMKTLAMNGLMLMKKEVVACEY
jgi:butyrate kinase